MRTNRRAILAAIIPLLAVCGLGAKPATGAAATGQCDRPWAFAPQLETPPPKGEPNRIPGQFRRAKTGEGEHPPVENQTSVWLAWNKERLLIRLRCEEPNLDETVTLHRGAELWKNDCVEIFLRPDPDQAGYFHFIVDAAGHGYARDRTGSDRRTISTDQWTRRVSRGQAAWVAEVRIPWSVLQTTPRQGQQIRASFGRERRAHGGGVKLSTWTPPFGFNSPSQFGHVVLGTPRTFVRATLERARPAMSELKLALSEGSPDAASRPASLGQARRMWRRVLREGRQLIASPDHDPRAFRQWARLYCSARHNGKLESLVYEFRIEQLLKRH